MSTRAQMQVEGNPVLIYKHLDGYPDGVLPTLEPFLKTFVKRRGWDDSEYMTAQISRAFAVEEYKEEYFDPYLSWGLGTEIHGDLNFFYLIRKNKADENGKVEIYEPIWQEYKHETFEGVRPLRLGKMREDEGLRPVWAKYVKGNPRDESKRYFGAKPSLKRMKLTETVEIEIKEK